MDAEKLMKVPDSIDRGTNALPASGTTETGKSGSLASGLARGTVGAGPAPTPAINSGKTLDNSLLSPTNAVSNGQGRQYAGKENPELSAKGTGTQSLKSAFESHLGVSGGTHVSNE